MLGWTMGIPLTKPQEATMKTAADDATLLDDHALVADREGRLQPSTLELMREVYSPLLIPKSYVGGGGIDSTEYCLALMELGRGDTSWTLVWAMHNVALTVLSRRDVSEEVRKRYFEMAKGRIFCAAISEPGSTAHDAESFFPYTVIATPLSGGGYEITGKKSVVSGSDVADELMLFARIGDSQRVVCVMVNLARARRDGTIKIGREWDGSESVRATRSDSATFNRLIVSKEDIVLETDTFLEMIMVEEAARTFASIAAYFGSFWGMLELAEEKVWQRIPSGKTEPVATASHVEISAFDLGYSYRSAGRALFQAFSAYDHRYDIPPLSVYEAFVLMCDAKVGVAGLAKNVAEVVQLGTQAVKRDERFGLWERDLRAALAMPPNEWTARQWGGRFQLLDTKMRMLRQGLIR